MAGSIISINRITAIGLNTFKEAVQSRAIIGLVLAAVGFILSSLLLAEMTIVGQGVRVVTSFGFFSVSLFCIVTSIVMGALLLHKEVEKKTIYTIISKPVHRYEFLFGKYMGMLLIVGAELLALGLVWSVALTLRGGDFGIEHIKGLLLIFFEVGVVTAAAVMFSAISSPIVTGLFSSGVFLVGRVVYLIDEMLAHTGKGVFVEHPYLRPLGEVIARIFPDLNVFNVSDNVLTSVGTSWTYVGDAFLYGTAYGVIFLAVAVLAFQRRDFI